MESYEVLKDCIQAKGVKAVASDLKLSTSLVYKWCQAPGADSGANNPLDRLKLLLQSTKCETPIHWLCREFGGFFVANPDSQSSENNEPALMATQSLLSEFSDILSEVTKSLADDNEISDTEANKIRKEWEDLKTLAESFVLACEAGVYSSNNEELD